MTTSPGPDATVEPLADSLRELVAILSGLKAAVERKAPIERLAYRIDEVADALGMSRRAVERGTRLADFREVTGKAARAPIWSVSTVQPTWTQSKGN